MRVLSHFERCGGGGAASSLVALTPKIIHAELVMLAIILFWYLAASVASLLAYGADKAAAQSGRWRVKESTLHTLALVGGWPGALVAQRMFRHKSRKPSFQARFMVTVVFNCVALVLFWWAAV